uniref:NADH-ubiquinone oxidoreductase chain 4 n=2 Tax=Phaneropterinae TaxID=117677 RepID=A0A1J0M4E4_9ORTH|nr:NADH dehydrogenase subunit 4 [Phaneroptera gracilis]APD14870.1 NADH dehydrogenase subunit 4 [Ducetia sp. NS-2016]ARN59028.1 NADH dehydrogenase subunit 4 [Phaneroptera gracilis]
MLKFLLMMKFVIPLCFVEKMWWVVQNILYFMTFMFMCSFVLTSSISNLSYLLGCDLLSYGLILLSFWICSLMITASESVNRQNFHEGLFLFMVLFLMMMLYCTFSSLSLFSFYLFFEGSLIPTLLLILGWGYQPERLQAGVYLLFYTLFASLPLLVGLFSLYELYGSLHVMLVKADMMSILIYLGLIVAFLVKMPMFLVHLWLPKAHVEAPVSGSMILAGVLLKMGGYGLLRVYSMLSHLGVKMNFIWINISLIGGVLVSLICLRQTDLKALIAYSSVVHMGMVVGGIMTMTTWGFDMTYTLMLAHGLCSSGLFCLANITYERLGSRSLLINKGLMNFMPSMALWWFLLSSSNMAAPPSLNLMGEVGLLNCLVSWCWWSMLMLMLMSFFSAAYSLYLYSFSQHGMFYSGVYSCSSGFVREYLLLMLHWLPLNILILKGDICLLWL